MTSLGIRFKKIFLMHKLLTQSKPLPKMKKTTAILIVLTTMFIGCKKDNNHLSQLCDGNNTNTYLPLALGNFDVVQYDNRTDRDSVVFHSGNTYVRQHTTSTISNIYYDTLTVLSNGDIYNSHAVNPGSYHTWLLLPGDLYVGRTWQQNQGPYTATVAIVDLNASIATPHELYWMSFDEMGGGWRHCLLLL